MVVTHQIRSSFLLLKFCTLWYTMCLWAVEGVDQAWNLYMQSTKCHHNPNPSLNPFHIRKVKPCYLYMDFMWWQNNNGGGFLGVVMYNYTSKWSCSGLCLPKKPCWSTSQIHSKNMKAPLEVSQRIKDTRMVLTLVPWSKRQPPSYSTLPQLANAVKACELSIKFHIVWHMYSEACSEQ